MTECPTPRVSYASIIAEDIGALCHFYATTLGVPELDRATDVFRGIDLGAGFTLAFAAAVPSVYDHLAIEAPSDRPLTRQYLTFELDSDAAVDAAAARAIAFGGRVLRQPFETIYHAYQAMLTDPEDNLFRLNHAR